MLDLSLPVLVSRVITLLIALTVHEFAHAFVADRFGDDTPRLMGRLTLNPLKHLDLFGSLMLLVVGFGWAKPVQVNPVALRNHSKAASMWVSLAGPASNFLLAVAAAIPIRLGLIPFTPSTTVLPSLIDFLITFLVINLLLMIFNLIPLSPLDGEKVLEFLLPEEMADGYRKLRPYGPLLLLALVFILPRFGVDVVGAVMTPIMRGLQIVLLGG
jgi:Zn-dependent protease